MELTKFSDRTKIIEQCETYYNECIDQENAGDCGIPLLNISVSVRN